MKSVVLVTSAALLAVAVAVSAGGPLQTRKPGSPGARSVVQQVHQIGAQCSSGKKLADRLESMMLNPQPEPPRGSSVRTSQPGAIAQLNPQPEPPGALDPRQLTHQLGARYAAAKTLADKLEAVMLNPQPEPPGPKTKSELAQKLGGQLAEARKLTDRLASVMLNPQPEPPGTLPVGGRLEGGPEARLNPQPEPPSNSPAGPRLERGAEAKLNPQPEPPTPSSVLRDLQRASSQLKASFASLQGVLGLPKQAP